MTECRHGKLPPYKCQNHVTRIQVRISTNYYSYQTACEWKNYWPVWDGWMNQAYSRLSTTHCHITDCKLVCMYWTRLRPAASLYSASPLKHHPTAHRRVELVVVYGVFFDVTILLLTRVRQVQRGIKSCALGLCFTLEIGE